MSMDAEVILALLIVGVLMFIAGVAVGRWMD